MRSTISRPNVRPLVWGLIAVAAGAAVARLPMSASLGLLAAGVLLILSLIDLRVSLAAMLIVAPLKTLIETEVPGLSLPLDVGQLLMVATLGMWLMRSIALRRKLDIPWSPIYIPIMLFTLAASFSLWVAIAPGTTLIELLKWIGILAMMVLTVALIAHNEASPGWIAGAILAASAVQAVIGIYEFRGGSGAAPLWILDFRYFRAFGSFGQPNPFGAFMGLTLPIALGATIGAVSEAWTAYRAQHLSWKSPQLRLKIIIALTYFLLAALIGAGLVVSWSRGAWLGFGAAAMVMLLFLPRRLWIGIALVGVLTIGSAVAVITGLAPASVVARISDFSQEFIGFSDVRGQVISDANYAVLERLAHWQAAVNMANDHPWLGVGFGNYEAAYPHYQLMNWPFPLGHAHNYYLNVLAETGIVGLVGYLVAWIVITLLTLRVLRRGTALQRGLALGLLGTWAHLAVHSLFDNLYVNNMFLHVGVMLGLIGGLLILQRRESGNLTTR